ncbi:MAG: Na+/H+ antiporter subunit E [Acidimicrobiales bacterium]
MAQRVAALSCWAFLTWVILTWTLTVEQMAFGVCIALVVGFSLAHLGRVSGPWVLLSPKRLASSLLLLAESSVRIVRANLSLGRRIWSPRRALRPGMIIVPTEMRSEMGVAAVGIITSLIVDNQIIDVDRRRHELQYHAVFVESDDPEENTKSVNEPIEVRLTEVLRHR